MPTQTDIQLTTEANVIKNETANRANTATRVGQMLLNLILSKLNIDKVKSTGTLGSSTTLVPVEALITNAIAAQVAALTAIAATPGTVELWAGTILNMPLGWLLCDGAAVSRATYSGLFGIIGATYGAGDGTTTFNLPDMGEKVVAGYKAALAGYNTIGGTGGAGAATLIESNLPPHSHYTAAGANVDPAILNTAFGANDAIGRGNPTEATNSEYRLDRAPAGVLATIGKSSLTGGTAGVAVAVDTRDKFIVLPYKIKT